MRLLLATTQVPFIRGGAELLTEQLQDQLRAHGHDVETVTFPFKWYPAETLVDHMTAARLADLAEIESMKIDRLIGLRFPAWLARHPDKVFWVIHQFRSAYDQWSNADSYLADADIGNQVRQAIWNADKMELRASKSVYTISGQVSERLDKYLNIPSTPIYHPPPNETLHRQGSYGDYLYFPSRIVRDKRQELVIEALGHTKEPVKVKFSGAANDPAYLEDLQTRARELGVDDRIEWLGRVELDDMIRLYAECLAVVYPPMEEDYGYITLESMLSGKAVITSDESGGVLEFIQNGKTGWITSSAPEALARAMDEAWADRAETEKRGQAAYSHYQSLNISWEKVVRALTR